MDTLLIKAEFKNNYLLHHACKKNDIKKADTLIKAGANINAVDSNNKTSLYLATIYDHYNMVDMLIKAGANINAVDSDNTTPLHIASYKYDDTIADMLIKAGTNINAVDNDNKTPLHIASYGGRNNIADMLIKAGANINAVDSDNKTPLYYAYIKNALSVVKLLREPKLDNDENKDEKKKMDMANKIYVLDNKHKFPSNNTNIKRMRL